MQGFVFDLDGTLLNTLADIGSACNAILGRHDYPQHPLEAYRQMVGNGFDKLLERATPADRKPDACAMADLVAETRRYYAEHILERTRPYPGIVNALKALKKRGCMLGVLSNKPDEMTLKLICHFFPGIFDAIQGARPDVPLKPDPLALNAMLNHFKSSPNAYIGDSNVDMITAKNAGVYPVGVAWGFRGEAELADSGARIVLEKPEQIALLTIPD